MAFIYGIKCILRNKVLKFLEMDEKADINPYLETRRLSGIRRFVKSFIPQGQRLDEQQRMLNEIQRIIMVILTKTTG
jgi:hypothetical protein